MGFGAAFTESSAEVLSQMSPERQEEVVSAYFRRDRGLGYQVGRVHMNSCDFSAGNWSCCDQEGDKELRSFGIDRYRRRIVPLAKRARAAAGGHLHLLASPWSPPAWMKSEGRMCEGGKLRPDCRSAWALHYVKFARALEGEGLPLWGFTVQNEPGARSRWESCMYSPCEERDFIRDFLGPTLRATGLGGLRLLVHDHNRDLMFARAQAIYNDPAAAQYVWGLAFHWYGDPRYEKWADCQGQTCFENVQRVHELRPDKHLVMSEACQEGSPSDGDLKVGERYAESIIKDLNHWTESWLDWNLLLDKGGGPNHAGNFCSAPLLADPESDQLAVQTSYYYIAHFSRYILPGAQRIACSCGRDALEATAFANPDGTIAAVVFNAGNCAQRVTLELGRTNGSACAKTTVPPHSIITFLMLPESDHPQEGGFTELDEESSDYGGSQADSDSGEDDEGWLWLPDELMRAFPACNCTRH
jgi:glucosylceramidase